MAKKLFIPGPTFVRPEVLEIMKSPPYGHRKKQIGERLKPIKENLRKLLYVGDDYEIIVSTSSGTGLMEAAVRNCVDDNDNVLMVSVGAFGDLWYNTAKACGKNAVLSSFKAGDSADPSTIWGDLNSNNYAAICVTHNETSTGVANNLKEIGEVVKSHDSLFIVDAVSSMAGMPIPVSELGIDVIVASSQKCFALPPGLAVAAVSKRAMDKSKTIKNKGYYFDFLVFKKYNEKDQTPTTPNEALIDSLNYQLDCIVNKEGIENRFERHKKLANLTRDWALKNGFELFPKKDYSDTVTCIRNTRDIDLKSLGADLNAKGYEPDLGYRKLNDHLLEKGEKPVFRIPHMGDMTEQYLRDYLSEIEVFLK